jgi:WD40 repeat protein/serine/threonine protein kinase
MQDLTNTIFREYHLVRCLGRGTSSSVYLGEHVELKILVAIKILHTHLSEKEGERFRNEAQLITRLHHPNIVAAHAYDIEDGVPFIIMSYAPHGSLRQRYPKGICVPDKEIVRYVEQIASALQYTHDRGNLIHRDVKPENMLLGPDDQVWLSDFGVSLIMPSPDAQPVQEIAGTLRYMAPEQLRGKPCFASDQYALGVVVYEWLCGFAPFTGLTAEIPFQHLHLAPPSLRDRVPNIPSAVEEVVFRALAKAPQARFPSVRAFANALEEAFAQEARSELDIAALPAISASAVSSWLPALSSHNEPVLQLPAPSVVIQPVVEGAAFPTTQSVSKQVRSAPVNTTSLSAPVSLSATRRVQRVSRRSVIGGLAGLALVVGGGVVASELIRTGSLATKTAQSLRPGMQGHRQTRLTPATGKPSTPVPPMGTTLYTYRGHVQAVKSVAWVSDLRVASAGIDSTVRVWDATSGGHLLVYDKHKAKVEALAVSPAHTSMASADSSGEIRIWDITNGDDHLVLTNERASAVRSVVWSPDGRSIATGDEHGIVSIWEAQTGMLTFAYTGHSAPIRSVAWSLGGQLIASCGVDETVQIWSVASRQQGALLTYRGHTDIVWSVAWSPDGTRLASASQDGTVQVWNATTGARIARHAVPGGKAEAVAWSPNGQYIAGGSDNGTVLLWGSAIGQTVLSYHQQERTIWSLAWSPDGQRIASASNDSTVSVWQAV